MEVVAKHRGATEQVRGSRLHASSRKLFSSRFGSKGYQVLVVCMYTGPNALLHFVNRATTAVTTRHDAKRPCTDHRHTVHTGRRVPALVAQKNPMAAYCPTNAAPCNVNLPMCHLIESRQRASFVKFSYHTRYRLLVRALHAACMYTINMDACGQMMMMMMIGI